jgi:hypothetical protein
MIAHIFDIIFMVWMVLAVAITGAVIIPLTLSLVLP